MRKRIYVGVLLTVVMVCGCAADLRSGNKFQGFADVQENKTQVYFVRNDNAMATKLQYVAVKVAKADSDGKAVEKMKTVAFVGKDMFVPALMEPGTYVIKSGSSELVTFKPNDVMCLEVGGKYRGVTVYVVEPLPIDECSKVIRDMDEGVPLTEAIKRIQRK